MTCLKSYLKCCPYTTLNYKVYKNIFVLFSLSSVSSPVVVRDYSLQGWLVFLLSNLLPLVPLFSVQYISTVCLSLPVICLSVTLSPPAVVHTLFLKKSVYNMVNLQHLYQNGDLTLHFLYHCSVLQPLPRP